MPTVRVHRGSETLMVNVPESVKHFWKCPDVSRLSSDEAESLYLHLSETQPQPKINIQLPSVDTQWGSSKVDNQQELSTDPEDINRLDHLIRQRQGVDRAIERLTN